MAEHTTYPDLEGLRVSDAMHAGLISCPPDASLRTVARMMATSRVHAILVRGRGEEALPEGGPRSVLTDADLLRAAAAEAVDAQEARSLAAEPPVTVSTTDELGHATELMNEHGVSHVIVVEPRSARPIGVLSTLDVARALAGFPERHPAVT